MRERGWKYATRDANVIVEIMKEGYWSWLIARFSMQGIAE